MLISNFQEPVIVNVISSIHAKWLPIFNIILSLSRPYHSYFQFAAVIIILTRWLSHSLSYNFTDWTDVLDHPSFLPLIGRHATPRVQKASAKGSFQPHLYIFTLMSRSHS